MKQLYGIMVKTSNCQVRRGSLDLIVKRIKM